MNNSFEIIIIGGGIAGAIAALASSKAKIKTVWFAPENNLDGGIQIPPNTLKALSELECLNDINQILTPISNIRIRDPKSISDLTSFNLTENYHTVSRKKLFSKLRKIISDNEYVQIKNESIVSIDNQTNSVTCVSSSGKIIKGSILIGADGSKGITRKYICGSNDLISKNKYVLRTSIPFDKHNKILQKSSINLWLGNGWHLVHYPILDSKFINLVLVPKSCIPDFSKFEREEFTSLSNIKWIKVSNKSKVFQSTYSSGNICLIGDAAHPFPPHLAQGAAQTFIDGSELFRQLSLFGSTRKASIEYSKSRFEKVNQVINSSNLAGKIMGLSGVTAKIRNTAILFAGTHLQNFIYDLWNYK